MTIKGNFFFISFSLISSLKWPLESENFLFWTRFLFQNLDRVQIFDSEFKLVGDTDTLDLDPRAFSQKLKVIEMNDLNKDQVILENHILLPKKLMTSFC